MTITPRYLATKTLAQVTILTALTYAVLADAHSSGFTRFDWLVA